MSDGYEDFVDDNGEPLDVFDPQSVDAANVVAHGEADKRRQQAQELLIARRQAYAEVFSAGPTSQAAVDFVMRDLLKFSRAFTARLGRTDRESNVLEGRAEVVCRVLDFKSGVDLEALYVKYNNSMTGD